MEKNKNREVNLKRCNTSTVSDTICSVKEGEKIAARGKSKGKINKKT